MDAVGIAERFWAEVWQAPQDPDAVDRLVTEDFVISSAGRARMTREPAGAARGAIAYPAGVGSTRVVRHIQAPRAAVYRALLDARAIEAWRVPAGMTCVVHELDAREGGSFRVSLTYDRATAAGKTTAHTDTYRGHFARLVPGEQVVEVLEFETADPALGGEMTMTTTLADADGGTRVTVLHEGIPSGVPAADNELGTRMALDSLAALLEPGDEPPRRG
jgi:uncharacterized protein YndB with AHSA1/START domain